MKGQTIFELVVTLGIAIILVAGIVRLSTLSVRNSGFGQEQAEATRLAQEATEWARGERDKSWDNFAASATDGTHCLKDLNWSFTCGQIGQIFTRSVNFSRNGDERKVTVTVSWQDGNQTHKSELVTFLTKWR